MAKASASVLINRPIQEVFTYTASPYNGPAFIPNLNENTNINPKEPSLGQTFDWRFNMAGVDLKGSAQVTEYDPPHKVVVKSTGESTTTWIYTFREENGGTRVSADVDYEIVESAMKRMANSLILDKLNQKTAVQMLDNLKTILES